METELLEEILDTILVKNIFKTIMSIKKFSETTDLAEYVVRRVVKEGDAVTYNWGNKLYIHYEKSIVKMFK